MANEKLTGIERDLVLQYLIDGNVPVTLTPLSSPDEKDEDSVHSVNSKIFPIALKAEHIRVQENGVIQLENPPESVNGFADQQVKVEFYFNRVGLYFISKVTEEKQSEKSTLSIFVPAEICRIKDIEETKDYDFSAVIYYECNGKKDVNTLCVPWAHEELFSRPVWKSIPLENQKTAKIYLENFVALAKIEKNAGNGIQLIPVCNYLTYQEVEKVQAVQDRVKPVDVLYIDHERIVFGVSTKQYSFLEGAEYGLKLCFNIKKGPIPSRDVFVTCRVNKLYKSIDEQLTCVDCIYTSIQEEDLRFLFEKATKNLFI